MGWEFSKAFTTWIKSQHHSPPNFLFREAADNRLNYIGPLLEALIKSEALDFGFVHPCH